jgi:hypothetical protein
MSDFLIDFREKQYINTSKADSLLKYYDDINVIILDYRNFTLILSRSDDLRLWAPYKSTDGKVLVALAGRIALDSKIWEAVKDYAGEGGFACKAIYQMYETGGINGLHGLNGSFVVLLYDASIEKVFIITDRCGMFPCFRAETNSNELVFGSHPDILADTCALNHDFDMTSLAEFLISGKLSFPFTYYRRIRALDYGAVHIIDTRDDKATYESARKYFTFDYNVDPRVSEWELAEDLGFAFTKAVNRRTLSLFGQTAISLSGGLDSRALLCSAADKSSITTFCFYDYKNLEYRLAEQIADAAEIKFIPLRREFDYYANSAEMGVRISGGMGSLCNNHYLGFRDALRNFGITNLIAGFYCDYLFKGLVLNKKRNKFLRTESLSSFRYENYQPIIWFDTVYSEHVRNRLDAIFPDADKKDESDIGHLCIEQKRLFPLCYEPDNAETLIPQRTMQWYLPIVDNDVINVYLKIPPKMKLNVSMYSKMVKKQCGKVISKIPNSNTGAKVDAIFLKLLAHEYKRIISNRTRKMLFKSIKTEGSWPDWHFYMNNSKKIESLWMEKKNSLTDEVLGAIIGSNYYKTISDDYSKIGEKLFYRLLTLKLWLSQRN